MAEEILKRSGKIALIYKAFVGISQHRVEVILAGDNNKSVTLDAIVEDIVIFDFHIYAIASSSDLGIVGQVHIIGGYVYGSGVIHRKSHQALTRQYDDIAVLFIFMQLILLSILIVSLVSHS